MRHMVLIATAWMMGTGAAAANFTQCISQIRADAARAGISQNVIAQALAINQPDDKVLRLSKVQPEFKTPIWDYMGFLVDEERVRDGQAMMRKYDRVLRAAEQRFGVDRHVIAAVWGVETNFGSEAGDNFLPHALATLVCEGGRRQAFWRGELMAALKLVDQGDLTLDELYGSWAGAFGQTQFIPTTYQRLAVDFDGDGRRDLVKSVPDALGSTANYLKRAGWRTGQPWMIEVAVPSGYKGPTGRNNRASLATWAGRGVTRADGRPLSGDGEAGLLLPAGPNGPGFLVYPNFNAIYAYNQAESYALAISHLADRMAGHPALRTPWPTDDPGLSRAQRLQLQKLLAARGYDVGVPDGKIGAQSRAAIAAAEQAMGMPATGRAGSKIYRALGGR
ncbi:MULTISPECIES: lytic murein transglycosylase [unclassified Chelatococcus]|uniref:lytic murein transglycosylase n=1 Tax=unclassified Chelatococcus TaxID=2638111 RepID=UPI001BD06B58|nr:MULTISPECIES: lytic murein transglycosylase [unclassified Chelatococcus]CAH1672171.1 Membrane-bound lytic murein transglycosylase B precursor [Hyphomicrobiales bacterium]MBS7738557.1 lytic murein transglycosylase [Chelatococcus sp. HY11]MBX3542961.1 lytic murein transglycosylase [Chelatococcus sp.]MCO5076912.1 lytic murein transglycosylase [Chelatococcus sp.]CAH1675601.1 Membrane-bound lytic murein transglycosylase B precursor [Hyphomicrobiales bacterium]